MLVRSGALSFRSSNIPTGSKCCCCCRRYATLRVGARLGPRSGGRRSVPRARAYGNETKKLNQKPAGRTKRSEDRSALSPRGAIRSVFLFLEVCFRAEMFCSNGIWSTLGHGLGLRLGLGWRTSAADGRPGHVRNGVVLVVDVLSTDEKSRYVAPDDVAHRGKWHTALYLLWCTLCVPP